MFVIVHTIDGREFRGFIESADDGAIFMRSGGRGPDVWIVCSAVASIVI